MRIVKLSTGEFANVERVRQFFLDELPRRTPPGKFRIPPGWLSAKGLSPTERLVFVYQTRIVFTALAGSAVLKNGDAERQDYPHYFLVDLGTLQSADEDFYGFEQRYRQKTGASTNLVRSQGWNNLPESRHVVDLWEQLRRTPALTLPEEVLQPEGLREGAIRTIVVNAYERNPVARERCISHYGTSCAACGVQLADTYGEAAAGLIHVHHLRPLAEIGEDYVVDPVKDLRPICPNCHAVVHRRTPPYSIDDVCAFVQQAFRRKPSRQ